MNRKQKGFTLIELMIAVVIVGILAAIALPSYQNSMRRGHRGSAQAFLMSVAQRQQQYLLDNRSYASALADLNMTVPDDVDQFYDITLEADEGPPPTFTVTATATGNQVSDGDLTINQAGEKTPAEKW